MGSSASVHNSASAGTFLTACDYEDGFGWQMPEEDNDDDDEGSEDDVKSQGPLMSVATENNDFEVIKKRHLDIKGKYGKFLANFMDKEISLSIGHAREISQKELKDTGSKDPNLKYIIDPYILADMETRGSVERVKHHQRDLLNSVKLNVAERNRALAYREGVVGARMALRCSTYMDEKTSEFLHTTEYIGVVQEDKVEEAQRKRFALQDAFDFENGEDSSTMIAFRNHFEGRKKRALRAERRKGTLRERYVAWKQRLREQFINYDYE